MTNNYMRLTLALVAAGLALSCIKLPKASPGQPGNPDKPEDPNPVPTETYIYPFAGEVGKVTAELTLTLAQGGGYSDISIEIPPLKYNKTLLVLFTQDDCMNSAYSTTWAAINGRPLSDKYFYNSPQLHGGDLPPDAYPLGKTLGSTDGAGREVRFSFATTLASESSDMDRKADVRPGYTANYYRFYMLPALLWDNVREMLNYDVDIAFHNVKTQSEHIPDSLIRHFGLAQQVIIKKLAGRGCKMLAEPDGNKNYLTAAEAYDPIQTIYKQTPDGVTLHPFKVEDDLMRTHIVRTFGEPAIFRQDIESQMALPAAERKAVNIGTHGTHGINGQPSTWVPLLVWLNDTYGKDGADCVWMPGPEEYFEYNYLRHHTRIGQRREGDKLHLTVELPGGVYFYHPSVTLNVRGLPAAQCTQIDAGATVTGLSRAEHGGELTINIDCRHALASHAEHFVERYEAYPSKANREDAHYFTAMLRESEHKRALLRRLK